MGLQPSGEEGLGAYLGLAIAHARHGNAEAVATWMQRACAHVDSHAKDYDHLRVEAEGELEGLEPAVGGR